MICYRDMTFCNHGDGCKCAEWRRYTPQVADKARRWWGGDGAPICLADLCGGESANPESKERGA